MRVLDGLTDVMDITNESLRVYRFAEMEYCIESPVRFGTLKCYDDAITHIVEDSFNQEHVINSGWLAMKIVYQTK